MTRRVVRPLLVGQAPSRESEGRPAFSTGGRSASRLSALLGRGVLEAFDAVNLLDRWPGSAGDKGDLFPIAEARSAASQILERRSHHIVIFVGKAVARAFGVRADYFEWVVVGGKVAATIPHPSGVNRWWNDPANERAAARFLRAAREVADHLGLELIEVRIPEPTADDLAGVVGAIEMPHKAQVEIGWACVHLAERMRADGHKVTFSGEGSDELWGSYGFAYHALKRRGWHEYRRDLFLDQARKNFPRCNKVFMARSVECRLPFLNPGLVEHALSLTRGVVEDGRPCSKAVLKRAVGDLLPARIVGRPKLAFQDALGMKAAAVRAVSDPRKFYAVEHRAAMRGGAA